MIKRIAQFMWGNFESVQEVKRMWKFGLILFLIHCMLTFVSMQNTFFVQLIGEAWLPYAKIVSVIASLGIIGLHSVLVGFYSKRDVLYRMIAVYGMFGLLLFVGLSIPLPGFLNAFFGIVGYCFSALFVSFLLFVWAFIIGLTTREQAKRSFAYLLVLPLLGSACARLISKVFSQPNLACLMIVALLLCIVVILSVFTDDELGGQDQIPSQGNVQLFEGIRLLLTRPYLIGLFCLSYCQVMMHAFLLPLFRSMTTVSYLVHYATFTGAMIIIFLLLGIPNFLRRLDIRILLLLSPFLMLCSFLFIYFFHSIVSLSVISFSIALFMAINLVIYKPLLYQLYISTSRNSIYKVFVMNLFLASALAGLTIKFVNLAVLCVMYVLWVVSALYVARTYDEAIAQERILS